MTTGHPGQLPYGPNYPRSAKPPLPQTVQNAFYLMLAGAVLQVAGVVIALTQIGRIRSSIAQTSATPSDANAVSAFVVVVIVFFGALECGLWIWMAYKNKAGRQWARIVATVFFGISCLGVLSSVLTLAFRSSINSLNTNANNNTHTTNISFSGSTTVIGTVVTVILWGLGLATIILLYRRQSGDYFRPVPVYGYGGPPGYAPGYGFPPQAYMAPGPPPAGYQPQGYAADRRPEAFIPPPVADVPPTEPGTAQEGFHPPE